eukprot:8552940-Alexandrium_andersonii.AAC.1
MALADTIATLEQQLHAAKDKMQGLQQATAGLKHRRADLMLLISQALLRAAPPSPMPGDRQRPTPMDVRSPPASMD